MTVTDEAPASIGQRLVWFLEHYRSESSSVSCPALFRIRGDLDTGRVRAAAELLTARHGSLRTTLVRRGRELVQRVHDRLPAPVRTVALPAGAEAELTRQLRAELTAPIPVDTMPVRFTLWRLGDRDAVWCVNMHHLISDAWSCGVVVDDVVRLLGAAPGTDPALRPVDWQYLDFCRWERAAADGGELRRQQEWWQARLAGIRLPVLPGRAEVVDLARPEPALAVAELPGPVGDGLRELARAERTTLFSVFLALYYLLLHSRTGQCDLTVASFFANRTRRELQHTVGFLATMLALRTAVAPAGSFRDLLAETRRTVLDAVVHQAVPAQMLSLPSLVHSPGRLNDVVFQMLPDRSPEAWEAATLPSGLEVGTFRPPQALSRFGLNLTVIPRGDRIEARLSYARNQFAPEWVERFLADFAATARAVLADPGRSLPALLGQLRPATERAAS
ncbi:hypothetical protein DLJ47_23730 [Micromonospora sp. S4605]|uniref:condensation domain-containing protein n=1 Tax=Micromonospora sp. S4605 TaxID=1420897 RepID=UPI000D6FDCB2|nr:condensation domain-containing protein [Micromonospora sp. S4605]PWU50578.1 hypothetical protein DLJ47_23730 [Micromonospora sp. S4605]